MNIGYYDTIPYLPGLSLGAYMRKCKSEVPRLYRAIDPEKLECVETQDWYKQLSHTQGHFEESTVGGRGDEYRSAQWKQPLSRIRGISSLFQLLKVSNETVGPRHMILDALGGSGTVSRAMNLHNNAALPGPSVITSDISQAMIADALRKGLPCVRQSVEAMLLRDNSMDGVMFAYGTHHIPVGSRPKALREAMRVLKPGCTLVLQDFEEGSPTARWYSEVLNDYTLTGHDFAHFTRSGLTELLCAIGLRDVSVGYVYDPFIIRGQHPEQARKLLVRHLCELFSLRKLACFSKPHDDEAIEDAYDLFRPYGQMSDGYMPDGEHIPVEPKVDKDENGYYCEFPRVALVGSGVKH